VEYQVSESREIYVNKWLRLREDRIVRQDGSPGLYTVVEKPTFAVIIPFDGEQVGLIEQYRHTVGKRFWELPMGAVEERPDFTPEQIARQELREETGLTAGTLTHLGHLYIAYGFCNQDYHVWLAEDLVHGEAEPETEEQGLVFRWFTRGEVKEMVADGQIMDSAAVTALYLWAARHAGSLTVDSL